MQWLKKQENTQTELHKHLISNRFLHTQIEAKKIKNEVENAISNLKKGIINQLEFRKIIFRNQQKLDDVLVEWA